MQLQFNSCSTFIPKYKFKEKVRRIKREEREERREIEKRG
jgi:hypothetical protein